MSRSFRILAALAGSAALAILAAPTGLAAQADPASRASLAREAWGRAAAAQRATLHDSAYADVSRAHEAWPEQPAYTVAFARLAARRGDDDVVARALRTLAAQQGGSAALADTSIAAAARRSPAARVALDALRSALAPVAGSRPRVLGTDTTFFAEGIDAAPFDGTLFLTSIRHRGVYAVARDGAWREVAVARSGEFASVLGVKVDGTRGSLWVTTAGLPYAEGYRAADSARAELLRLRIADGVIEQRFALGDGTGAPGELALTPRGDVLVSDAAKGVLYRLRASGESLEIVRSPLLRSPQGIAVDAAGEVAWVADWTHGLLRWDLRNDAITPVAPLIGTTLLGIDGLVRDGARLIGVQNGVAPARIVEIVLDRSGSAVRSVRTLDRPAAPEGEPTVGTMVGSTYVYVSSSQWPFWNEDGTRTARAGALPAVVVRELLPR